MSDGPGFIGCYSLLDLAAGQMCQRLGISVGESVVASSRFTMIQINGLILVRSIVARGGD